jgi:predicted  nucleic acid-binding Zn-ribbon protein
MDDDHTTTSDAALEILKRLEPAISGLASRLTSIEGRLTAMESRLTTIEGDVVKIRVEVANLQGRVSQMPTTLQLLTAIVATVFGTAGILFAALNYAKAG